jgi:hypothetical protein
MWLRCETGRSQGIVYLGGLHPRKLSLAHRLRSCTTVDRILFDSEIETVALQAGVIARWNLVSFETAVEDHGDAHQNAKGR